MVRRSGLVFVLLMLATIARSQELYVKTFGRADAPALIFLHGGPGYNSAAFEATTPQRLADSGFFVIVYDRRGEGQSRDSNAKFNFVESVRDLEHLYDRFGLKQATLIGHSFGGVIGTKFATAHPQKVKALALVGAPVSLQASFRNIIDRCRAIYQAKGDSVNLRYIAALEAMDTASMMYSTYCFGHAMQNGFYTPKERTPEAKAIFAAFRADTALAKKATQMDFKAPRGFWESEHYTTLDLRPEISALQKKGVSMYGLYGKEDGLYAPEQVAELGRLIGPDRVRYLDACSHNVFIDQQRLFIEALQSRAR